LKARSKRYFNIKFKEIYENFRSKRQRIFTKLYSLHKKPGIVFRDITTLLNNKEAFNFLIDHLVARYEDANIDYIAGIESRGFIFGAALAARLRLPFVPIRKPKKLPFITLSQMKCKFTSMLLEKKRALEYF